MKNKIISLATFLVISLFANHSFAQNTDFDDDEFAAFDSEFSDSKNSSSKIYDPIEPLNRKIFLFNEIVDIYFLGPIVKKYSKVTPKPIKTGIHNFVQNLTLPVSTLNSIFQGKTENTLATFSTFLINSTIGVFGIFDVASSKNIKYNFEDFGQTLAHYSVDSGLYLVLPILGPSNLRDTTGRFFDVGIDITGFNALEIGNSKNGIVGDDVNISLFIISGLDRREQLIDVIDATRKESFDVYATLRSFYFQNRQSQIKK